MRLALAAENYWDDVLFERWRAGTIPATTAVGRFSSRFRTEELPLRFEDTLFQMAVGGKLPVMAHPERYRPFWEDTDRLAGLGGSVALVVDLGAVGGYHGWTVSRAARRLCADRIAHAAASDVHAPSDAAAAAGGIAWIKKKLGPPRRAACSTTIRARSSAASCPIPDAGSRSLTRHSDLTFATWSSVMEGMLPS
jgi:protein-tyrosine phosphatase